MAGVSTKEIKNRIRSMESTKQITKAMEMVAASKLRQAQARILNSRPYFEILYSTINDIVDSTQDYSSPYLQRRDVKRTAYIVIACHISISHFQDIVIVSACKSAVTCHDDVHRRQIGRSLYGIRSFLSRQIGERLEKNFPVEARLLHFCTGTAYL